MDCCTSFCMHARPNCIRWRKIDPEWLVIITLRLLLEQDPPSNGQQKTWHCSCLPRLSNSKMTIADLSKLEPPIISTIIKVDESKSTKDLGTPPDGAMIGMAGVTSPIGEDPKWAFKSGGWRGKERGILRCNKIFVGSEWLQWFFPSIIDSKTKYYIWNYCDGNTLEDPTFGDVIWCPDGNLLAGAEMKIL